MQSGREFMLTVKGAPAERGTQPPLVAWGLVTVALPAGSAGHEVACDSQHQQSAPGAARRTKINSSDPPLTTICAAYPTPPFLPFFHPPIELASWCPCGRLHLDGWIDNSAICFGELLQVGIGEIHI
jgi:hypothetical protein